MKYLFNFGNIIAAESLKKETRLGRKHLLTLNGM